MKKIGILGGGVWGSALAKLLSGNKVTIYARDEKIISSINEYKINPKLKYVIFNDNVKATSDISKLKNSDYVFIALPTQNVREVINLYGKCEDNQNIIIGSKGIEITSHLLLYDVISSMTSAKNISVLSGPCFSNEVAQNLPTAVTLATKNKKIFNDINLFFNNNNFCCFGKYSFGKIIFPLILRVFNNFIGTFFDAALMIIESNKIGLFHPFKQSPSK